MSYNKSVTATFSQQQYTLTIDANFSRGVVTGGGVYADGTSVSVTAIPDLGYTFSGWSGACSGTGSCVVIMDSNKMVIADFILELTLTANASPSDGGSVSGAGEYEYGTSVTVIATPASGYIFSGWSGACSGIGTCSVDMIGSDKTVTANFSQQQYILTNNANPSSGGTVTGGGTYSSGDTATVTATPYQGYTFTGWSGACSGSGSCSVTMSSNKSVTAAFFQQQQYTLTTQIFTTGPSGVIGGSATGGGTYQHGTVVTVTAAPNPGFIFTGWSDDCSGMGECTLTMDDNKIVDANFSQSQYTLTTNASPTVGGSVTGGGTYGTGATAIVNATPNTGYVFSGWSGDCSGNGVCSVTMNSGMSVTATFSDQPWAHGKSLYSFIDSFTLTPTTVEAGSYVTFTCTTSGLDYQLISFDISGSDYFSSDDGVRGMWDQTDCHDQATFSTVGTFNWSLLEIRSRSEGMRTYYTPDGLVMDHDWNVVRTHSLNIPAITVTEPPPVWAYGIDKYSFIDTISVSPSNGSTDTSITMTCTVTGVPTPRVELSYQSTSGHTRAFVETSDNWQAYGQCSDAMPLYEAGTYDWTSLVLYSTYDNFRTFYFPNGDIKDHDGNVVGSHSLDIPQIIID
jgi:uncharacterized repeat protein (TIGR02543 family)